MYKGVKGQSLSYIPELLNYRTYSGSLSSSEQNYLEVGKTNTKLYGDRAFSIAGPKHWNELPVKSPRQTQVPLRGL